MGNICCEELEKHYEAKITELKEENWVLKNKDITNLRKDIAELQGYYDIVSASNKNAHEKIADLKVDNQELKTQEIIHLERISELEESTDQPAAQVSRPQIDSIMNQYAEELEAQIQTDAEASADRNSWHWDIRNSVAEELENNCATKIEPYGISHTRTWIDKSDVDRQIKILKGGKK